MLTLLLLMLFIPGAVSLYGLLTEPANEKPTLSFTALSQWYEERFFGQQWLASSAARLRFALGMEPTDGGVIGREGFLFLTRHNVIQQARGADGLDDAELEALVTLLGKREAFWAHRGVVWLNVIAPGKSSVYLDKLPARFSREGPSRIAQINSALARAGIANVDLLAVMRAHADGEPLLYFKTDSHWTCYAGFLAYDAIVTALERRLGKPLHKVPQAALDVHPGQKSGDIAANVFGLGKALSEQGIRCEYPPVNSKAFDYNSGEEIPARIPRGGLEQLRSVRFHNTGALNSLRVAVLRDSYFWSVQPLLDATFSDVLYFYHWHLRAFDEQLLAFNPDVVIYEYTDRALHLPVQHLREHGSLELPPLR